MHAGANWLERLVCLKVDLVGAEAERDEKIAQGMLERERLHLEGRQPIRFVDVQKL